MTVQDPKTSELFGRVESALDTIRPYLFKDGGDVRILEISDAGNLKIEFLGACETCPMSAMTLKAGIEQAVLKAVPEIKSVEAVNI